MHPHPEVEGVYVEGTRLFTRNLVSGKRVYGETLVVHNDAEYRDWSPNRSKLAAYIRQGGRYVPIGKRSNVLYLGAANGTTASHVSDIVTEGSVYCVEFSPRSFRDLVGVCADRGNMIPILGDATRPQEYSFAVGEVDVVYQDVAQKGQARILMSNMETFSARYGMLAIKSRSEDVTAVPKEMFRKVVSSLREKGYKVLDSLPLGPYEKDHAMVVVER